MRGQTGDGGTHSRLLEGERLLRSFLSSVKYFLINNHAQDGPGLHILLEGVCLCTCFCFPQPTSSSVCAGLGPGRLSLAQVLGLQSLVLCLSLQGGSAGSFKALDTCISVVSLVCVSLWVSLAQSWLRA